MPFCFICSIRSTETSFNPLCICSVIEPERGTSRRWYLFIGSDGLSAVYGRKLILLLNGFLPLLMKSYDSCWLSRASDASRKFGMSHILYPGIFALKILLASL